MYQVFNFISSEARFGCGGGYTRGNPLLAFNSSAKETHRHPLISLAGDLQRHAGVLLFPLLPHADVHVLEGEQVSTDDFLPPEVNVKHQSN